MRFPFYQSNPVRDLYRNSTLHSPNSTLHSPNSTLKKGPIGPFFTHSAMYSGRIGAKNSMNSMSSSASVLWYS